MFAILKKKKEWGGENDLSKYESLTSRKKELVSVPKSVYKSEISFK